MSKYCVALSLSVPCHFFFPSFPIHRFVVWTFVFFSDDSKGPRSRASIDLEVDHTHVRFQVNARCFRIQKATLNILAAAACWKDTFRRAWWLQNAHRLLLCQGARMPKELRRLTSQTNLECIPMRLLPGFSMHIVPPAQMMQIINITLLGTKGRMPITKIGIVKAPPQNGG